MFQRMLMVVFGAGASFDSFAEVPPMDSAPKEEFRPPLAAGLFEQRFAKYFPQFPECLGLFPRLAWAARETPGIEVFLEDLAAQSDSDHVVRQQLVALRFYLDAIIRDTTSNWEHQRVFGATNYAVLLDRIDTWRRKTEEQVVLATFNYDPLLENAAFRVLKSYFRNGFTTMADYIDRPEYKILKLHGSTTWLRVSPGSADSTNDYVEAIERSSRGSLELSRFVHATRASQVRSTQNSLVPAIAIPVQAKSQFECPPEHVNALLQATRTATQLLIIGWKGMEQHFLSFWAPTSTSASAAKSQPDPEPIDQRTDLAGPPNLKSVLIVDSGEGGQITETQLRNVAQMKRTTIAHSPNGFSQFLRSKDLDAFLT
jgi:hypothetical protein